MTRLKKIRAGVITLLVAGYVATDAWLYAFSRMSMAYSVLLDVLATGGFVILGAIAYAATRGDDDIN